MTTEAEARAKLEDLVAASTFPALDADTITRELRDARRVDQNLRLPSDDTEWAASSAIAVDDVVVPTIRTGRVYRVSVSDGTTGTVEPVWPTTAGGSVTADGVTYVESTDSLSVWEPTYDLYRAAANLWQIKAGLVSNRHAFGSNAGNYNPEQVYQHCLEMAALYKKKLFTAIRMRSDRWDQQGRLPAAHYEDAV